MPVCTSHVCVSKVCVCVYTVASCARGLPKKPIYMKRDLHKRPTSHKFIKSNFRHAHYLLGSMYVCVCVSYTFLYVRVRAHTHVSVCVCVCVCVFVCVYVCFSSVCVDLRWRLCEVIFARRNHVEKLALHLVAQMSHVTQTCSARDI